jgi:orotate phosphoribosyltransferase-like protein
VQDHTVSATATVNQTITDVRTETSPPETVTVAGPKETVTETVTTTAPAITVTVTTP